MPPALLDSRVPGRVCRAEEKVKGTLSAPFSALSVPTDGTAVPPPASPPRVWGCPAFPKGRSTFSPLRHL